jgi:hypothetical protein
MNIIKTSKVALKALNRNKMRSFLTALGIIIGAAVHTWAGTGEEEPIPI